MRGNTTRATFIAGAVFGLLAAFAPAQEPEIIPPPVELVVSVADQRMALVVEGGLVKKYPISTSKFGLGDSYGSYKTPLGRLRICDKVGENLPIGSVLKQRHATGEILPVNAPGRDPIVTRILWLEGLESQNDNARGRGIYIHGTVEENRLGEPVSYGCIRMKSRDVIELFEETPVGTTVRIIEGKLPRFRKPSPQPEILLVKHEVKPKAAMRMQMAAPPARTETTEKPKLAAKNVQKADFNARPILFADKSGRLRMPAAKASPVEAALPEADGPKVLLTTIRSKAVPVPASPSDMEHESQAAEPRIILAMQDSILMSGLPAAPQRQAVRAEVAAQVENAGVSAGPRVQTRTDAASTRLELASEGPDIFLGLVDVTRRELPLDALTAHLLAPPQPLRLAFRTTPAAVLAQLQVP
ncbi:MAG TPA: L,D-transpeptidase family protein [Chthoniobacteraceae bacterium]